MLCVQKFQQIKMPCGGMEKNMKILITGAKGMVGTALAANLYNIKENKNTTRSAVSIDEIYEYDIHSTQEDLEFYCSNADFVFHLAGVNRPKQPSEFMEGNFGFSDLLLNTLKKYCNRAGIMLASSIQAALTGRYQNSDYGKSKLAGEELFFRYGKETGAKVAVYRFPNLMGHSRPNYNSAVSTFCYSIANQLPYTVHDRAVKLELLYIDDLVEAMFDLLEGKEQHCEYPAEGKVIDGILYDGLTPREAANGRYCYVSDTYKATLGEIVDLLEDFQKFPVSLMIPHLPSGSFAKKLYSLYLTYLPKERMFFDFTMNSDARGSFTELLKTKSYGQVSVNVSRPGITKGEHWHNSKWELFIVVSGHGLIRQRRIGTNEIVEFKVSAERLQAVYMIPGWTHSIVNLSETEDLVTIIWANEMFDAARPDTFRELV